MSGVLKYPSPLLDMCQKYSEYLAISEKRSRAAGVSAADAISSTTPTISLVLLVTSIIEGVLALFIILSCCYYYYWRKLTRATAIPTDNNENNTNAGSIEGHVEVEVDEAAIGYVYTDDEVVIEGHSVML